MGGLSNYVEVIQADCDSYVGGSQIMSRLYKQIVIVMWGLSNYVEVIQADCDSYVGALKLCRGYTSRL